jgi:TonB family protein
MAAVTQTESGMWLGDSRRRGPRYPLQTSMDVAVLRSGIPDTIPGRAVNICEHGVAAVMAGELLPGETVGVELRIPFSVELVRTRATVRYGDKLRCGLEFLAMPPECQAAIRDWVRTTAVKAQREFEQWQSSTVRWNEKEDSLRETSGGKQGASVKQRNLLRWPAVLVALIMVGIGAVLFWWKWDSGWHDLEPAGEQTASQQASNLQVPAEVMEKLLVHRVEPVYPPEAKKEDLQGIIAVDIIIGQDGSVVTMRPLNGPDVLARAAMDALRWWKFEPYRVNGNATPVETIMGVEFKR